MDVLKVFVSKENSATIRCPSCGATKSFSVERFKSKSHSLKLRCGCERLFKVDLDFRRVYRKETRLSGYYAVLVSGGNEKGRQLRMLVDDLSCSGIGMTTTGTHGLKIGDTLLVEFVLDDPKETIIEKKVIVRRVLNSHIGCEFQGQSPNDKELGFYLMP